MGKKASPGDSRCLFFLHVKQPVPDPGGRKQDHQEIDLLHVQQP